MPILNSIIKDHFYFRLEDETQTWKDLLPSCFTHDGVYASHPSLEKTCALVMFIKAYFAGVSMTEMRKEVRSYLQKQGFNKNHIDSQIKHLNSARSLLQY